MCGDLMRQELSDHEKKKKKEKGAKKVRLTRIVQRLTKTKRPR